MNKVRVTKMEMRTNYNIIKASYCRLQNLLNYEKAIAYSAGINGWSCDYYDINGVIISTGYAPIASDNTNASYELMRDYDDRASEIINSYELDYDTKVKQVKALLSEFIKKAIL
jgi:hypothetical protein